MSTSNNQPQSLNTSTSTPHSEQQDLNSNPNAGVTQNGQAQNGSQNGNLAPASALMNDHWKFGVNGNPLAEFMVEEKRPKGSG
ncbi:hypothetical protein PMIN04_013152 [Paraphaeosphaeria minitans]|uniref:Uncharacterized protein n=1 Tax=Paraphaeosphaeria minitans TaxID=565426 RepID=A0A9P6G4S4_9PLEO|nr:hypothetical protein PMIN01_13621 [Paraphaeosphaeria minitans]